MRTKSENQETEITYKQKNDEIECVIYRNSVKSFAPHTHSNHLMIGYIEKGQVCIIIDGVKYIVTEGDEFQIPPNTLHEIKLVDGIRYSMVVMCVAKKEAIKDSDISLIQETILEKPGNAYLIEEMVTDSALSPYHMIRKFRKALGLTPHQFQVQCKVRLAQRLLEEKHNITDVAYEAGFCDQSHLIRCFRKIVGMSPTEYINSIQKDD